MSKAQGLRGSIAVAGAVLLSATTGIAQTPRPAPPASTAQATPRPYAVPRTPWGHPDFQGAWSHFDSTPLQTPNPDPVSAAEEAKANATRYAPGDADESGARRNRPFGGSSEELGRPRIPRRKSLVVDPANGRIPALLGKVKLWSPIPRGDHWSNHDPGERCITRGMPGALYTGLGYGRGLRILQTPNYVVFFPEIIHDARIVPLDGRPHVGSGVRLWNGDPRGRWDGDTLVIETTNFNNQGEIPGDIPQTEGLNVVERLTRIDANTIEHRITYEDPNVFSRPWTVLAVHVFDPTYVVHEYACHEGNWEYMSNSLTQGRVRDAQAATKR